MYRKRLRGSNKFNERLIRTRLTRLRNRLELPERDYPIELPDLRRRIVVEDYDLGETVRHEILLYKSNRIDCYRAVVDGQEIAGRIGWARILEKIRKAFLRFSNF
jgi:hypothetical protein